MAKDIQLYKTKPQQVKVRRTSQGYNDIRIINKPRDTNFPTGIFIDYLA